MANPTSSILFLFGILSSGEIGYDRLLEALDRLFYRRCHVSHGNGKSESLPSMGG